MICTYWYVFCVSLKSASRYVYAMRPGRKILKKKSQKYYGAQLFSTYQHIRMISKGSCDTEDWSNDAENSALHHRNKLHFKIYLNRKQLVEIVIIFLGLPLTKDLSGRLVILHFKQH